MQSDSIRGAKAQERFRMNTATVLDPDTRKTQGHIVLTWWSRLIALLFAIMLIMMLGLLGLVYLNSLKIQELEIKVEDANTQNPNR